MAMLVAGLVGSTTALVLDDDVSPGDMLDSVETLGHGIETAYDLVHNVGHNVMSNPINFAVGLFVGVYFS